MASALAAAGAVEIVTGADELTRAVAALLADRGLRAARCAAAARAAAAGQGILDAILARLAPWLDGLAPVQNGPAEGVLIEGRPTGQARGLKAHGAPHSLRA
jgi:hypothetical protein